MPLDVLAVATIAELRALRPANEAVVTVAGYNSVNDGGGGTFYWRPTSSRAADDGVVVLPLVAGAGRWERDTGGRPLHVAWFGATGTGGDDTAALQAAFDAAAGHGGVVELGAGRTYMINNLILPNARLQVNGNNATLARRAGGDPYYLVGSSNHLRDVAFVGQPLTLYDVNLDGRGIAQNVLVLQVWNSHLKNVSVRGAVEDGLVVSAVTRNGSPLPQGSSVVNTTISECEFQRNGNDGIELRGYPRDRQRPTDMFITNNFIFGNGGWGINMHTNAGVQMTANHLYVNGSGDVLVSFWSLGGMMDANYFESPVGVKVTSGYLPAVIQDSIFRGRLEVTFGPDLYTVVSNNNTFLGDGHILHAYFGSTRVIQSIGDHFATANPYRFHDPASTGRIVARNSYADNWREPREGTFTGPRAASQPLRRRLPVRRPALRRRPFVAPVETAEGRGPLAGLLSGVRRRLVALSLSATLVC